jgi:hypothetical protein
MNRDALFLAVGRKDAANLKHTAQIMTYSLKESATLPVHDVLLATTGLRFACLLTSIVGHRWQKKH